MNALLLNRELASSRSADLQRFLNGQLLRSLHLSLTRFEKAGKDEENEGIQVLPSARPPSIAHYGGVNAIDIDKFDGRYLLSGGAESTISLWDLETLEDNPTLHPQGTVARSENAHSFGITDLAFYPFDAGAFLSSSFDSTLKIYSSETLTPSATFPLDAPIYALSLSPIAQHILVACATQLPSVRLVDLRSGAASHTLAGHAGAVLSVAWSPTKEHELATGGTDGTVRFWDVRRSAGQLSVLDMEDSVGLGGYDGRGMGVRHPNRGKAHAATVNGVVWTADGRHVVTVGHDDKMRVWDVNRSANTLINFGPYIKNRALAQLIPCLVPTSLTEPGKETVLFPSERGEILMFELFEGKLLSRFRIPGFGTEEAGKVRPKDLAWRAHTVEFYSTHADGSIRAWKPRAVADVEDEDDSEEEDRKRKRKVLDDIHRDVTKKRFLMNTNESN
jgi:DNA excision repair protein ERCC-8